MAKQARIWKIDHKKLAKHGPKELVTFLAKKTITTWPEIRDGLRVHGKRLIDNKAFNQLREKEVFILVPRGATTTSVTKKTKPIKKAKVALPLEPIKKKKDVDIGMAHDLREVDDEGKDVVQGKEKEKRNKKKLKVKEIEDHFLPPHF